MKFTPSTVDDLGQIADWTKADPYHDVVLPEWWLTGNDCLFAGRVEDDIGVVLYIRMDRELDNARLHIQFPPPDQVTKKRVARTIMKCFPKLADTVKQQATGIVFASVSELLIKFMSSFGFVRLEGDDYVLRFKEI
jgi:hypothetical protein